MPYVRDRLDDLQRLHYEDEDLTSTKGKKKKKMTKSVNEYLDNCEAIRRQIIGIRDNTRDANNILLHKPFYNLEDVQNELNPIIKSNEAACMRIHNALKDMVINRDDLEREPTAETKMKYMQYMTLREDFQDVINGHIDCAKKYEALLEEIRRRIQQSIQGADYVQSEDDANESQAFIGNYLLQKHDAELQLRDVQERHNQLIQIEYQLKELRDLFVNIAILVDQQQESVNRAEHHAAISTRTVEAANEELIKAKGTKRKLNKMRIWLIIGGIIVGIIIIILIFK